MCIIDDIKAISKEKKITQKAIAKRLGITEVNVSQVFNKKVAPNYKTVIRMVEMLDYRLMLVRS